MEHQDTEKVSLLKPKKSKAVKPSFKLLLQYANRLDLLIFSVGLFSTAICALSPSVQIIQTGEILENMQENYSDMDEFYESEKTLAFTNYALGGLTVLVGMLSVVSFIRFRTRQGLFWKQAYFRALAHRPMKWFDKRNPAELGNSIDRDCNTIEMGLGDKAIIFLTGLTFFYFGWIICFYYSIEITLVLLLKLPISIGSHYFARKTSELALKEKQDLYQSAGGIAEESLEGIKTIASCNAQHQIAKRYQAELEPLKKSGITMGIITGFSWGVFFFQFLFFVGLGYYVGAILIDEDVEGWSGTDIGAKEVFVTSFISAMASLALSLTMPSLSYIFASCIAAAAANKIIQKKKKYDGGLKPQIIQGSISFEEVYFNYPTKPDVNILQGVSFQVAAGDSLAIVGETGSGKSTIIQLIEGFYYSSSGTIKIDDINIKDYDLSSLREFISLVSQEPILFNSSIAENIRMGKEDASLEDIASAAGEAEASYFIESLPEKYETWVGVKGALISGGQKQRIALARALIKKPKILLLDEATSALDVNTENAIQTTIEKIMLGTTTVIVAQRLSTVKRAKQIVVLRQGSVVESGTYEELIQSDGHFKRLLGVQREGERKVAEKTEGVEVQNHQISEHKVGEKKAAEIKNDRAVLARVVKLLREYKPWVILACLGALVSGSCIPIFSYFVAVNNNTLVDPSESDKTSEIQEAFFYITGTSLAICIGLTVMCGALSKISQMITHELRYKSLNSLLYYDQKFFDRPKSAPSVLSLGLSNDCEKVSNLGGPLLGLVLFVFTSMIGGFALGLAHDAVLAVCLVAFLPFLFLTASKAENMSRKGLAPADLEKTSVIASDAFTNIKTVQAFNREEYFYNRYIATTISENAKVVRLSYTNGILLGLRYLVLFSLWGSAAWYGAYMVKEGNLAMDDMMITFFAIIMTNLAFVIVSFLAPDVEGGIRGGRHLFKIIDYVPDINARSDEGGFIPIEGLIEFKDVGFAYEGRDRIVLQALSFRINPGDKLGITGTTGSGKSTIGQLLLRFYDPTEGMIFLDGLPLKDYNIRHLREGICWVGQEPILFKGSILYNLQIAAKDATIEEALEALNKAQANDIVEKYGLESDVGLRGNKMSGGQKQRIAIARALLRKPKVLVFDESTSALDPITEEKLWDAIKDDKMTLISIAHRLRSIRYYDQIILIEGGTLVESGNHNELMAIENGYYRELYKKS